MVTSLPATERAMKGASRSIRFAWHCARSNVGKLCAFFHGVVVFMGEVAVDGEEGRDEPMVLEQDGGRGCLDSVGETGKVAE